MNFTAGNEIIYSTEVLKSNFCNFNNAYILVRGDITILGHNVTQLAFSNFVPFTKCITKSDGTTVDDAEDLGLVMLLQNLLEYSSNYFDTTSSSWFYSKDEVANFDIANNDDFKSFKYKAKLLGNTETYGVNIIFKNATMAVRLKYLSNFWRSLEMLSINGKAELPLIYYKVLFYL